MIFGSRTPSHFNRREQQHSLVLILDRPQSIRESSYEAPERKWRANTLLLYLREFLSYLYMYFEYFLPFNFTTYTWRQTSDLPTPGLV